MIEMQMPQDILKYKPKFIANLSFREAGFAAVGLVATFSSEYYWFFSLGRQAVAVGGTCVFLPFLLFGFKRPFGQRLEKVLFQVIMDNFIAPVKRRKETRHPEFEKYEKMRVWEFRNDPNSKKKSKNKEIKIQKSKEYRSIK